MRGKQAQENLFESPYAMTILPARGRSKAANRRAANERDAADAPQPASEAAPVAPVAQAGPPAAVRTAPIPVPAAAGAPGFGVPPAGFPPPPPPTGFAPPPNGFPPPGGYAPPPNGYAPPPNGLPPLPGGFAPTTTHDATATYQQQPVGYPPASAQHEPHHHYAPPPGDDNPDGSDHAERPNRRLPSKRLALLAVPLVLVIGAAAYVYVPKLLDKSSTPAAPTISLPATVAGAPKITDKSLLASAASFQATARAASPLLVNVSTTVYGTVQAPVAMVAAGLLPSSASTKAAAEQTAAVQDVDKALSDDPSQPEKLTHLPFSAKPGQLWCGASPADDGGPATDCIYIDQHAVIVSTVYGTNASKNISTTEQIISAVER